MGAISTHTRTDWAASVESRWWYGVAALPVVSVGSLLAVGLATGLVVISGALGGAVTGPVFGLLVLLGVVAAAAVIAACVLLPVSLYFDRRAISRAGVDWHPDPGWYALLGVFDALFYPVGIAVACYYLYRRHRRIGAP
jgi:hypothetical protein